jgi:ABC-type antimicrobial peptide transport system permease subunit
VINLRAVDTLPWALAIFLAILATLATVHALMQTTRMRRHELAVLRMLGFQRRQCSLTVASQATTIALIGAIIGIPLGIVTGRLLWQSLADRLGVVADPVTPVLALVALAVAIAVVANLAAIVPARRAARLSPATLLRNSAP